jgi:hypothetical protein
VGHARAARLWRRSDHQHPECKKPALARVARCVVPFTSFCEYADSRPRKTPTWFALHENRPLAVFAGLWTTWHGRRGTLRQCLAAGTDDIARRFFRAADRLVDIPWQIAVGSDLQHPGVHGKRPAPLRFFNWYIAQLFRAAQTDVVLTT